MTKKFFALAAASLCLLSGLSAAASGVTVEVQGGYSCDYGVDIPFTPSARTSRYTFALYAGGNAAGSPEVTAEVTIASAGTVHLPLRHNLSGPSTWTLSVTAHVMPGREAFDRETSATKVFTTAPTCGCPAGTAGAYYAGKGTASSPYRVTDGRQLAHLGAHPSACFLQTEDISLSGSWTPIGTFSGVYDGGGHVINNLQVATSGKAGLFGSTDGATIRALGIAGSSSIVGTSSAGAFAAEANATQISECFALALVRTDAHNSVCGGLIGKGTYRNRLDNCYFAGSLSNTRAYNAPFMGGLMGIALTETGGVPPVITGCYTAADYQFYYANQQYGLGSLVGSLSMWTGSGWGAGTIQSSGNYWLAGTAGCPAYAVGDFSNGQGHNPSSPGAAGLSSLASLPAGFDKSVWTTGSYQRPTYNGGWATVSAPVLKVFQGNS